MKKLAIVFLSTLFIFSCTKENIDELELIEKENEPTIVELDNSINFRISRSSNGELTEGSAYRNTFNETYYTVASKGMTVECPGSSTSWDGDGVFFIIQWVVLPDGSAGAYYARFITTIDGEQRDVSYVSPPECGELSLSVEFEEIDDRVVGTCTGRFFYLDYQGEPFNDCMNWVDAGELTASFDVPLVICN